MANINTGLTLKKSTLKAAAKADSLKGMLDSDSIKERFNQLLGKRAPAFISSLLAVCNQSEMLKTADPMTVITAAAAAAAMDLPVNQNLGFAYIVPFKNGKTGRVEAQFIVGYKGYRQLAMRSGQYVRITSSRIYEGEIKAYNRITGEIEFGNRTSEDVVGYLGYFKLINGYEQYLYMSKEEMEDHAAKYVRGFKRGSGKWGIVDFDTMAEKTIIRRLLSKYGILSIEMQGLTDALAYDGAVLREDDQGQVTAEYDGETIDLETGEILNNEPSAEEQAEIHAFEMEQAAKE